MATQIIAPWTISPFTTPAEIDLARREGWFQLTQAGQRPDKGTIESRNAFATAEKIIRLEFDYLSWGGNGGKGLSIYLFDASVPSAGTGGIGGVGLGYVKMVGAYVGIGLDEPSSFTLIDPNAMTETSKDLGVGLDTLVTIRGSQARNYFRDAMYKLARSFALFSTAAQHKTRQEAMAAGAVKHVTIQFTPKSSKPGYTIDLSINGLVIYNKFDYPHAAPASMKIGIAATNGPDTSSNHEVRNFRADVSDPALPAVNLFGLNTVDYVVHHGANQLFDAPFLTDGDRVKRGWDGSGAWDQYPGEHLDYWIHIDDPVPEVNTIIVYCRQDDALQQEPTDVTTFTQHGAIDFSISGFDQFYNNTQLASVTGNNLAKRTVTVPPGKYYGVVIDVSHAASHGASIVLIEGYML